MDIENQVRRLQLQIRLQAVAVIALLIWVAGGYALPWLDARRIVRIDRQGNAVRITSPSDGPFVITHLTVNGWDAGNAQDQRVAALPRPLACIDSVGVEIQDISKLDWRDVRGDPASVPVAETRLSALLLRPEYVEVPKN